jgi:hypothetical protein
MVLNSVLVALLGFFIKRWMNGTKEAIVQHIKDTREDLALMRVDMKELRAEIKNHAKRITVLETYVFKKNE